jgi:hypothetical protein
MVQKLSAEYHKFDMSTGANCAQKWFVKNKSKSKEIACVKAVRELVDEIDSSF